MHWEYLHLQFGRSELGAVRTSQWHCEELVLPDKHDVVVLLQGELLGGVRRFRRVTGRMEAEMPVSFNVLTFGIKDHLQPLVRVHAQRSCLDLFRLKFTAIQ
jgi:hypothetical protein